VNTKKLIFLSILSTIFVFVFSSILFAQSFTKTYKLSWEPEPKAVSYIVEISTDPSFRDNKQLIKSLETKETSITLEFKLGVYYFRVAGKNLEGKLGPWSEVYKFVVEAPLLENINESTEDLETLLYPEVESSFDNFPHGEYYDKLEPYSYDDAFMYIQRIERELFGDVSKGLLINLYYYLAFQHYEHGNVDLALSFYLEAEKINKIVFKGKYKIKSASEVVLVEIKGLKIKYTYSQDYELDKFFLNIIETYIKSADTYYYKGNLEMAYTLYNLVLLIDPYNEYVLKQIEKLKGVVKG